MSTNRTLTWNQDGICLNPIDARQVIECYRKPYSPQRFQWLMKQATKNGHSAETTAVFEAAIEAN